MRRSARGEQSAFSLFPFLAVLLCTMGAMVVLLVAMAHVSRQKASREAEIAAAQAEAAKLAVDSPERRAAEQTLEEARRFAEEVARLKGLGEERLVEEQERLSGLEDHLRRLKDEAESLKAETIELIAVEQENFDDEKIARQELQRLNELIGELEDEIDEMKHAATGRERRFAVVPLRDQATGTLRPPVYYECGAEGVTLQPEGIELTVEDLVAPKFSSPVAAASRAVTRFYEEHPEARAANEVGRPYPLLVVRPDGVESYYRTRAALEQTGVDYGYQPIGDDWPMEYGDANSLLAQWVEDALDTARQERRGLARIVPRLANELAGAGLYSAGSEGGEGGGFGGEGQGTAGIRVSRADPEANNPFEGLRIEGRLPSESGKAPVGPTGGPAFGRPLTANSDDPGQGQPGDTPRGATSGPAGLAYSGAENQAEEQSPSEETDAGQQSGNVTAASSGNPEQQAQRAGSAAGAAGSPNAQPNQTAAAAGQPNDAGAGQATMPNRNGRSRDGVPMVRPIRVYVADDRIVVLPDRAQSPSDGDLASSNPQSVGLNGATSDQINEVIAALKRHADSWGIAGSGMYWDPRLVLNVASDGVQRADDLRQLLEAADLKVQAYPVSTATRPDTEGGARAPR